MKRSKPEVDSALPRMIAATASVAPIALVAPLLAPLAADAVAQQSDAVTIVQPLDQAVADIIHNQLDGQLQVGDRITVDLDTIFEEDPSDLVLTVINHNPYAADVSLLDGDLHISGKNPGSAYVDVTARKVEQQVSTLQRLELRIASGIEDAQHDGVTIDDIIRYTHNHANRTFSSEEMDLLLGQIKPSIPVANRAPESTSDNFTFEMTSNETHFLDVSPLFYDEDGDSLTYEVEVLSSPTFITASIHSGSMLSLHTSEPAGEELDVLVRASDGGSYRAEKHIDITVIEETGDPGHHEEQVTIEQDAVGKTWYANIVFENLEDLFSPNVERVIDLKSHTIYVEVEGVMVEEEVKGIFRDPLDQIDYYVIDGIPEDISLAYAMESSGPYTDLYSSDVIHGSLAELRVRYNTFHPVENFTSSFTITAYDSDDHEILSYEVEVLPNVGPMGGMEQVIFINSQPGIYYATFDLSELFTHPNGFNIVGYLPLNTTGDESMTVTTNPSLEELEDLATNPLITFSSDTSGYAAYMVLAMDEVDGLSMMPGLLELFFADSVFHIEPGDYVDITLPPGTNPIITTRAYSEFPLTWELEEDDPPSKLGSITEVENGVRIYGATDNISDEPALVQIDYTMTIEEQQISGRISVLVYVGQN